MAKVDEGNGDVRGAVDDGASAALFAELEAVAERDPSLVAARALAHVHVPSVDADALWVEPSLPGCTPRLPSSSRLSLESARVLGRASAEILLVPLATSSGIALHAIPAGETGVRVSSRAERPDALAAAVTLDRVALRPPLAEGERADAILMRFTCLLGARAVAFGARALALVESIEANAPKTPDRQSSDFRRADMCVQMDAARLLVQKAFSESEARGELGASVVLESLLFATMASTEATFFGILSTGASAPERADEALSLHLEACRLRAIFAPGDELRAVLSRRLLGDE